MSGENAHIRKRKIRTHENAENEKMVNAMLHNFDMAMLHPDAEDLRAAQRFVKDIYEKLEREEQSYE